jgi:hypothetical protein
MDGEKNAAVGLKLRLSLPIRAIRVIRGPVRRLWAAEARRRLEAVRCGRVKTIPGDEALAQVIRPLRD